MEVEDSPIEALSNKPLEENYEDDLAHTVPHIVSRGAGH